MEHLEFRKDINISLLEVLRDDLRVKSTKGKGTSEKEYRYPIELPNITPMKQCKLTKIQTSPIN